MAGNKAFIFVAMLATLLMVAGCSLFSSPKAPPDTAALFHLGPEEARIFVYGFYVGDPGTSLFRSTYRVRIDGGFYGDLTDDQQFISVKLLPGDYKLDVEEIGWLGNSIGHAGLKVRLKGGTAFYAAERMPALKNPKASLIEMDSGIGTKEIMARTRICFC